MSSKPLLAQELGVTPCPPFQVGRLRFSQRKHGRVDRIPATLSHGTEEEGTAVKQQPEPKPSRQLLSARSDFLILYFLKQTCVCVRAPAQALESSQGTRVRALNTQL